jgi:hypothetical protein
MDRGAAGIFLALSLLSACRFDASGLPGGDAVVEARPPDAARTDTPRLDGRSTDLRLRDAAAPDGEREDAAIADSTAAPDAFRLDAPRVERAATDAPMADAPAADAPPIDLPQPDRVPGDVRQPDARPPDAARPDAMLPDATVPCSSIFGAAPQFTLCSDELAATCKFYTEATVATSCDEVCKNLGASCVGVMNNLDDGGCATSSAYQCDVRLFSKICECRRPP